MENCFRSFHVIPAEMLLRGVVVGAAILATTDAFVASGPTVLRTRSSAISAHAGNNLPTSLRASAARKGGVLALESVTKDELKTCQEAVDELLRAEACLSSEVSTMGACAWFLCMFFRFWLRRLLVGFHMQP